MKHEIEIPEGMQFDAENSIIKFKPIPPQKTPDQLFQEMWEGCTIYHASGFPDSVFYMKNGEWFFELNTKNNTLWCRYKYVWHILETGNNWDCITTQSFIKKQVEERFKMMGVTPCTDYQFN